ILLAQGRDVKIADFGVAKALYEEHGLTSSGIVLGTPLYISPEAARGDPLDGRSDLYSLGATFYHLLAGAPPFPGETPLAIAYRHIHEPVRPLAEAAPAADPALARLVERLLAKDPAGRFQSCEEALEALEAVSPEHIPAAAAA